MVLSLLMDLDKARQARHHPVACLLSPSHPSLDDRPITPPFSLPNTQMRGFQWLDQEEVPRLLPTRLAYVGLRDLDPGEKAFIRALGIKAYTMHEVDRHGIGKVGGWMGAWMSWVRICI